MRARRTDEPAPSFTMANVYEYALRGHDDYVERHGEPSPELLEAVDARRERQARNGDKPWTRVHIPAGDDL